MRALVVIPTYNERQNLPLLVHALLGTIPHLEVLVVDDGPPTAPAPTPGWLGTKDNRDAGRSVTPVRARNRDRHRKEQSK